MDEFEYMDGPTITQYVQRNNPDSPSQGAPKSENVVLVKRVNNTDSEFYRLLLGSDRYLNDPSDITLYLANIPSQKDKNVNDLDSPFYSQLGLKFRPNSTSSLTANTAYIKFNEQDGGYSCLSHIINDVGIYMYSNTDPDLSATTVQSKLWRYIGNQNLNGYSNYLDIAVEQNTYYNAIVSGGLALKLKAVNVNFETGGLFFNDVQFLNIVNANFNIGNANMRLTLNASNYIERYTNGVAYTMWDSSHNGHGTQMNADMLDGYHSSYFTNANNISAGILSIDRGGLGTNIFGEMTVPAHTTVYNVKSFKPVPILHDMGAVPPTEANGYIPMVGTLFTENCIVTTNSVRRLVTETRQESFNRAYMSNGGYFGVSPLPARADHTHFYKEYFSLLGSNEGGLGYASWNDNDVPVYTSPNGSFTPLIKLSGFNQNLSESGIYNGNGKVYDDAGIYFNDPTIHNGESVNLAREDHQHEYIKYQYQIW